MFLKLNSIKFGAVTLFGKKEATEGVMVLEISKRYKFDINNNRTDIVEGYNVTVNISEKGGQTIKVDNECKQVIDEILEHKRNHKVVKVKFDNLIANGFAVINSRDNRLISGITAKATGIIITSVEEELINEEAVNEEDEEVIL